MYDNNNNHLTFVCTFIDSTVEKRDFKATYVQFEMKLGILLAFQNCVNLYMQNDNLYWLKSEIWVSNSFNFLIKTSDFDWVCGRLHDLKRDYIEDSLAFNIAFLFNSFLPNKPFLQ